MGKNLVIVESPAKAKTIKKFLGNSYKIEASFGHVRDLPKSELGIDKDNNFEPKYITIRGKGEILSKLRREAKSADKIYLATDPDREGEAISWHLAKALKLEEKDIHRISFNEITKIAVKNSIKQARPLDMNLVNAQQSRRALDRIVGYGISPLLWKKIRRRLSAGRVQSVALRVICDREDEINSFVPEEYWTIEANFSTNNKKKLIARFHGNKTGKVDIKSKEEADNIVEAIKNAQSVITDIKKSSKTRKPNPPFTTSVLQQEASKQLGFAVLKTMRIAQQLYEGVDIHGEGSIGLVSYIRTDSVRLSDEAYEQSKKYIIDNYGEEYCNPERVIYKSRGKTQEAHEAIRPTDINRTPESIIGSLSKDQYRLYKLIWSKTLSSVMSPALYNTLQITISSGDYILRAGGQSLKFEGFLKVYNPKDDSEAEDKLTDFSGLNESDNIKITGLDNKQHFTSPPPRYSEASLVKTLEEIGVGRPSTYAPTITTILARGYVIKEAKNIFLTDLGEIVNEIMKSYFSDIVDIDFTAKLEQELDHVEDGELDWRDVVKKFYYPFEKTLEIAEDQIEEIEIEDEKTDIICEKCGSNMVIKYGRFGKFLACPSFPNCRNAKPYLEEAGVNCPLCNGKIMIKKTKKGRKYFGCENNPSCEFMVWNKPLEEKCPNCGGVLVEKGNKNIAISCSNTECGYTRKNLETKSDEVSE